MSAPPATEAPPAAKFAIERPTLRAKVAVPVVLGGLAVGLNLVGRGLLGLAY